MGFTEDYKKVREENAPGFHKQQRGLIKVWGKESVQFLNGLITNDIAKIEDGAQMMAAFPNVQGRLLAVVRVLRQGEEFFFETDEVTHDKLYQNLFRFTFAGDFFIEDISANYAYFEIINNDFGTLGDEVMKFDGKFTTDLFVAANIAEKFEADMRESGAVEISDELYETLRIENGVPKYGVDMDETTVVLETGLDEAVSFNKGCYIGQEIIARIHFRGHVAKQLTGLILDSPPFQGGVAAVSADGVVTPSGSEPPTVAGGSPSDLELKSDEGKAAGRITSLTYSPRLDKYVAIALVRYEFLPENTELKIGEISAKVTKLPVL